METLMLDFDSLIGMDYTTNTKSYILNVKNLFGELETLMQSIHIASCEGGFENLLEKLLTKVETLEAKLDLAIEFYDSSSRI